MTDRLHRTICAVVPLTSAEIMVRREGWQLVDMPELPAEAKKQVEGKRLVRKTFDDNREIVTQLDGFANLKVTAWVE